MPHITYQVVEHDGGWAYRVGDVYSETYPTHESAAAAARDAAERQHLAGRTETIEYQDRDSRWHQEIADGGDRPETDVADTGEDTDDAPRPIVSSNSPARSE